MMDSGGDTHEVIHPRLGDDTIRERLRAGRAPAGLACLKGGRDSERHGSEGEGSECLSELHIGIVRGVNNAR